MPRELPIEQTRNIGIIAHIDAGKTTVTESILYNTGLIHKIGTVHEGETVTDWMEQERERGITITAAAVTSFWTPKLSAVDSGKKYKINIIDTPGHVDFTAEVERSLRVLDGAVAVFDGSQGVEPQSETVWRQADKYEVPRVCFVNKMDKMGADFYMSLESIQTRLSPKAVAIQLPIGQESSFSGIIDLIEQKAFKFEGEHGENIIEIPIPEDEKERVAAHRGKLFEKVAEANDQMMNKYVNGEAFSIDEIRAGIRSMVLTDSIYPVMCGSALGNIGVQLMLDSVTYYLPSPIDVDSIQGMDPDDLEKKIEIKPRDDEPFSGLAFKIATDPFVGKLVFFRVYSGVVQAGTYVINTTTGEKERLGRIVRMHANHREDVTEVFAGEIAAAVGLKGTKTGDTLCAENRPVLLDNITFPHPVISLTF